MTKGNLPDKLGPARIYEPLTRLFDRREKPYGWMSSDGGASTRLMDGRDAWAFSDSGIGVADSEGRFLYMEIIRNCLIFTNTAGDDPNYFMDVYGSPNELTLNDAAFIDSIGSWSSDNAELSLTSEQAAYGKNSMKAEQTADGDLYITRGNRDNYVIIKHGRQVSVKATIKTLNSRKARIGVAYYDIYGKLLNKHESKEFMTSSNEWTRMSYTGPVPPEEAVYSTMFIHIPDGKKDDVSYIGKCGLYLGDASMQSWSLPGKKGTHENLVNPEDANLVTPDRMNKDWFWFAGTISIGTKLYVMMGYFGKNDDPPPWCFEYKNKQFIAQWDIETNEFEGITQWSDNEPVQWGSCFYKDDKHIYTFGYIERDHYLMRVPADDFFGTKEYWTGSTWSTNRTDAALVIDLKNGGNIDGLTCINGKFIGIYIPPFGPCIKQIKADAITGPWVDEDEVIFDIPVMGTAETVYAYIPRIHDQFTSSEGIVFGYNGGGSINNESMLTYSSVKFAIGPAYGSDEKINLPFPPTAPVIKLTQNLNDVELEVEWDGCADMGGKAVPVEDNCHVDVHISEIDDFLPAYWTKYGVIKKPGSIRINKPLMPNRKYYVKFILVNEDDIESKPGKQAIIATGDFQRASVYSTDSRFCG